MFLQKWLFGCGTAFCFWQKVKDHSTVNQSFLFAILNLLQ
jgi:hypothetical protein